MEEDWIDEQQAEGDEDQQQEEMEEEIDDDDEDDILDMGEDDEANERVGLLMRFCPHDSSMLYPQVCVPEGLVQTFYPSFFGSSNLTVYRSPLVWSCLDWTDLI